MAHTLSGLNLSWWLLWPMCRVIPLPAVCFYGPYIVWLECQLMVIVAHVLCDSTASCFCFMAHTLSDLNVSWCLLWPMCHVIPLPAVLFYGPYIVWLECQLVVIVAHVSCDSTASCFVLWPIHHLTSFLGVCFCGPCASDSNARC